MSFPVQVFAYKIICETELLSHRMGLYWNANTWLLLDVYLCLAYVSPFENNVIDSHGTVL